MSVEYGKYLEQHTANVHVAYCWLMDNLPEVIGTDEEIAVISSQIKYLHDRSKYDEAEYEAYDQYFYGGKKTPEVKTNFNVAWLHHIHNNPHHWQHWVLINDDPNLGMIVLDMPHNYIIEMICDWWAFSWKKGKLDEIFSWYDEHKEYMKLSDKTRKTVEDILEKIRTKLEEINE